MLVIIFIEFDSIGRLITRVINKLIKTLPHNWLSYADISRTLIASLVADALTLLEKKISLQRNQSSLHAGYD